MNKKKPVLCGLAQAMATLAVCAIAVLMAERLQQLEDPNDGYLDSVALLLLFVTSALVCGSIVLAYPAYLFLQYRLREGYLLLMATIGWLVAMLGCVLAVIAFSELRLHVPF